MKPPLEFDSRNYSIYKQGLRRSVEKL